jgi:general secretion pathway protein L
LSVPSALSSAESSIKSSTRSSLRQGLDAASHLLGFTETRIDREPAVLTLRIGAPGDPGLTVIDRRDGQDRTYRLDAGADDLADKLAAIRGGRPEGRVKVVVDPASCFIRTLDLPSVALPRMRAVLAQELEAATPFRADQVFSDWYVEGEDPGARTLRVRHVVLKRARLAPLLAALAGAGLKAGIVAVGPAEDRTMPVDLLSGGHHALPGLLRGSGNLALAAAAGLFLLAAFLGLRQHQAATLAALDDAFAAARRAAGPGQPPAVQAGIAAILAERGPPLARTWDAVAAALPDTVSAQNLRLTGEGLELTLLAPDPPAVLAALAQRVPGFGAPELRQALPVDGGQRVVVALPRLRAGARP